MKLWGVEISLELFQYCIPTQTRFYCHILTCFSTLRRMFFLCLMILSDLRKPLAFFLFLICLIVVCEKIKDKEFSLSAPAKLVLFLKIQYKRKWEWLRDSENIRCFFNPLFIFLGLVLLPSLHSYCWGAYRTLLLGQFKSCWARKCLGLIEAWIGETSWILQIAEMESFYRLQ